MIQTVGKRKTSIARIKICNGNGSLEVNNKTFNEYFKISNTFLRKLALAPLYILQIKKKYNIYIHVLGGGKISQLEAIKLALARALLKMKNNCRPILKRNLFLRRDSRIKERRKYGLKKARKASQYSKR